MTILLSADNIKALVGECPPGLEPDDSPADRRITGAPARCFYRWNDSDPYDKRYEFDCPACWRAYLEGEAK